MRNKFPGHFRPAEAEYAAIWASAHIALDTNVLLNMYRYSERTANEFISVLESYSEALWLPYRVAEEFFDQRTSVISDQVKKLQEIIDCASKLHADLNPKSQHPLVDDDLAASFNIVKDRIINQLEGDIKKQRALISGDTILPRIASLFTDEKVGDPFEKERIEEVLREGAKRYDEKIPPGYMDADKAKALTQGRKSAKSPEKSSDEDISSISLIDRCKPFGDLFVWLQIMQKAADSQRPIIFVTADAKEDWWEKKSNMMVGPRPELIREFRDKTGQQVLLYSPEQFLVFANRMRAEPITEAAISEVEGVSLEQAASSQNNSISNGGDIADRPKVVFIKSQLVALYGKRDRLQRDIEEQQEMLAELEDKINLLDMDEVVRVKYLGDIRADVHNNCMKIMNARNLVESQIFNLQHDLDLEMLI